jgi:hypothetical protein
MRWIVYSLIVINIAIAGYFLLQPAGTVPRVVTTENIDEGDTLVLLTERSAGTEPVSQQPMNAYGDRKLCYALGPYTDDISVRVAQARALKLVLTGLINEVEVPNNKDTEYWVLLPPQASRAAALEQLKQLQKRGVDSYIITQGELVDGVSLGLFRKQDSATRLSAKVRGLGFTDVTIREIGSTTTEYWLEIREISKLDDRMRRRVRGEDAGVQWQMVACEQQGTS